MKETLYFDPRKTAKFDSRWEEPGVPPDEEETEYEDDDPDIPFTVVPNAPRPAQNDDYEEDTPLPFYRLRGTGT